MLNYNRLRFIDAFFGVFICFVITVFERCARIFRARSVKENPVRKILIMKFWGLGSILMTTPALRALKDAYPGAEVTYFTLSRNEAVCKSLKAIDMVVTANIDKGIVNFLFDLMKAIIKLRAEKYDLLLDTEFFTRFSAIITYAVNPKTSVGFGTWEVWRGDFHTHKVPFNRYWHLSQSFSNMVSAIGVKVSSMELMRPEAGEDDKRYLLGLLSAKWKDASGLIAVNVNNDPMSHERRWPKAHYVSLLNSLIEKYGAKIVLIGSGKEEPYVREVENELKAKDNVLNLAGKTSIGQLICLFERSMFLLTNDSGPMHLAVALKLPTVSFFGPETPVLCGPRGEKDIVFFKNIDCSPCINVHSAKRVICSKHNAECMEKIEPEDVLNKIGEVYFSKR